MPVAPAFKRLAPEHLDQLRQHGCVTQDSDSSACLLRLTRWGPTASVAPIAEFQILVLRLCSFVRVDNFITSEAAARLKADAMVLRRQGGPNALDCSE